MNKHLLQALLLMFLTLVALSACSLSGKGEDNAPLEVEIAAGVGSAPYQIGVTVYVQAVIRNAGSTLDTVEISVDNRLVASIDDPNPQNAESVIISENWRADAIGSRVLRVVAVTKDGERAEDAVTLTVVDVVVEGGGTVPPIQSNPTQRVTHTPGGQVITSTPLPTLTATTAPASLPAAGAGGTPYVIFTQQQNVRNGPGLNFLLVGTVSAGERMPILALSLDGLWYNITFFSQSAWVYAPLTEHEGDLSSLSRIAGPPTPIPPPTAIATAIPPATATTQAQANLTVEGISIFVPSDGSVQPKCGVPFTARVTIRNTSNVATTSGLTLMQNIHVASGTVTGSSGQALVPVTIDANGTHTVEYSFTIDTFFGEQQRINFIADANGEVAESNENDNQNGITYTLEKAGCG